MIKLYNSSFHNNTIYTHYLSHFILLYFLLFQFISIHLLCSFLPLYPFYLHSTLTFAFHMTNIYFLSTIQYFPLILSSIHTTPIHFNSIHTPRHSTVQVSYNLLLQYIYWYKYISSQYPPKNLNTCSSNVSTGRQNAEYNTMTPHNTRQPLCLPEAR